MPLSELEQRCAELPRDRQLVIACETGRHMGRSSADETVVGGVRADPF